MLSGGGRPAQLIADVTVCLELTKDLGEVLVTMTLEFPLDSTPEIRTLVRIFGENRNHGQLSVAPAGLSGASPSFPASPKD